MDGSTRLVNVIGTQTRKFHSYGQSEFRIFNEDVLPNVEALLDGISREVEAEHQISKQENSEALLTQALVLSVQDYCDGSYDLKRNRLIQKFLPHSQKRANSKDGVKRSIENRKH